MTAFVAGEATLVNVDRCSDFSNIRLNCRTKIVIVTQRPLNSRAWPALHGKTLLCWGVARMSWSWPARKPVRPKLQVR